MGDWNHVVLQRRWHVQCDDTCNVASGEVVNKERGYYIMWLGFLSWHAEMSPLQEEWRNCGQQGLCRSKGRHGICTYQVSFITSHSLQTHMFVISDANIPLLCH